jgi:hypothetical protein
VVLGWAQVATVPVRRRPGPEPAPGRDRIDAQADLRSVSHLGDAFRQILAVEENDVAAGLAHDRGRVLGSKTSWPTATSRVSPPSSATRPTPSRPPIAGSGGNCPYSPVRVITSDGVDRRGDDFDQRLSRVEPRHFELRRVNHVLRHLAASFVSGPDHRAATPAVTRPA